VFISGTCQFEGSVQVKGRSYGFCTLQRKRFCDMSIWEDCQNYEVRRKKRYRFDPPDHDVRSLEIEGNKAIVNEIREIELSYGGS